MKKYMKQLIVISSVYKMDSNRYKTVYADHEYKMSSGGYYAYTRTRAPPFDDLQDNILRLYERDPKNDATILFPSGMCAISTVLFTIFNDWQVPVILYSKRLYCDTPRTIDYLQNVNNRANAIPIDVRDNNGILGLLKKYGENIACVYVESCANPSGDIMDPSLIEEIKKYSPYCNVIYDNTWLSPASFNPFTIGADIVVESGSKYISGGNHICGHVTGNKKIIDSVINHICIFGIRLSPREADMINEHLKTLENRIKKTSVLTLDIAKFLSEHKNVNRVIYPGLDNHWSHKLASTYFKYLPSVLIFHMIFKSKSAAVKWGKSRNYIKYSTSFGKTDTMIDTWPIWGAEDYYDADYNKLKDPKIGMWFRIAIGYETDLNKVKEDISNI